MLLHEVTEPIGHWDRFNVASILVVAAVRVDAARADKIFVAGAKREPLNTVPEIDRTVAESTAAFGVPEDVMTEPLAGHLRASLRDFVPHLRRGRGHAFGDIEFKEAEVAVREQGDIVIRIFVI